MCEKPLSALCTEKSNIKKSCKGLIKPTGCITEFLSGKKCNMQEENQNLNHFDNIKNKNFSIKFDECGKAEKEKLISKNFNSLPLFYYVSDLSHNGPGQAMMECPLRQPISGSSYYHHHYHHIPDQTKSLQELQNEVGALLEFRNLVIETFPDLKNKMASMSASHTLTGNSGSNSPFVSRLEWEPGIRIKRKLVQLKDSSSSSIFAEGGANDSTINSAQNHTELSSSSLTRSRSNSHSGKKEPKSGEGNGSVVIQDSGFSTETSSSKEAHSASSTTGALQGAGLANRLPINELDDELLNLLDVIHRKSNKVREEIESMQNHETNKIYKNQATTLLLDQFGNKCSFASTSKGCVNHKVLQEYVDKSNKDDVQLLRKERDELLYKLAEMEAETLTGKIKIAKMQNEVDELIKIKRELEEHLKLVLNQKMELNARLQEFNKYHSGFTNNSSSPSDTLNHRQYTSTPLASGPINLSSRYSPTTGLKDGRDLSSKSTSTATVFSPVIVESDDTFNTPLSKSVNIKKSLNTFHSDIKQNSKYNTINLGHLDGFISEPCHLTKQRAIDSRKFSAILKETNVIELQRHLLTLTVQNQVLTQKLNEATKSNFQISQKFEKSKEDIDDFRFQLEEKKIELEGTKAQLRVLESQTSKLDYNNALIFSSTEEVLHSQTSTINHDDTVLSAKTTTSEHIFDMEDICRQISTPSMKAMVPIAIEDIIQHNSSSTESAQDHNENVMGISDNVETNITIDAVQRREKPRPPSRIPLPGSKIGLTSPKPPSGRLSSSVVHTKAINASNTSSISNKYLCRSTGNLCGKSPTNLNRPSSAQSLRKDNSLLNTSRSSTSSIPVSSNLQSVGSGVTVGIGQSMSSSLNQGKFNPSQQNQQKHNFHNSKFNSNSPIVKHKREHMSSSRARNLDSLSRSNQNSNNNNISSFSSSAPGRSNNNNNNINNNNSKNNNDRSFFNSSSTNFHRLNNNNAKKDSSFNFAQTDNISSKSIKPKMNITTNIRRISTAGRSTTNNPITELQQQHLQLQQKPQGQQLLLQQNNSQNADVDNGKVRNLRSTVLGWLKF